jgi:DNA-binding MarR family transcriptional regulator
VRPIIELLRELQRVVRSTVDETLASAELTSAQMSVLTALELQPELSNAELSRLSHVTPQTTVEFVRELERRELITRVPHPEGGRALLARLSTKGRKRLFAARMALRSVENRLTKKLTPREQASLIAAVEHCIGALRPDERGK